MVILTRKVASTHGGVHRVWLSSCLSAPPTQSQTQKTEASPKPAQVLTFLPPISTQARKDIFYLLNKYDG